MIDSDDIGNACLFGSITIVIILVILYFVFSKPKIDDCHQRGGVMVKIEGESKCVNKDAFIEAPKKGGAP